MSLRFQKARTLDLLGLEAEPELTPSFLHHEELYHSTPETQTDESYNHPEDLEHFRSTSPMGSWAGSSPSIALAF